jgi:hypothetical protein
MYVCNICIYVRTHLMYVSMYVWIYVMYVRIYVRKYVCVQYLYDICI